MLLILSARAVGEDIAMHYGRLPPSFLPLGARRLFALQAELAAPGEAVALTLARDFDLSDVDARALDAAGVAVVRQDPGLSLAGAIADALRALAPRMAPGEGLRLLYGDTLVGLPEGAAVTDGAADGTGWDDRVAVQASTANYQWAYLRDDWEAGSDGSDGAGPFSDTPPERLAARRVVCGYYAFSDPAALRDACEAADRDARGSIVAALNAYHAVRPLAPLDVADWFDFGHLPLYFQSKQRIMVARAFNDLSYERHTLVKRSADTAKMRAEAMWYEALPPALALHAPRYHGRVERDHRAGYAVEYLYHPLLSDLAAFGRLPLPSWLEILAACLDLADLAHARRPDPGAPEASAGFARAFFERLLVDKTWDRLTAYLDGAGMGLDDRVALDGARLPPIREMVARAIAAVPPTTPDHVRFWHGDLFYGNLFYDFTARRVLAIDPRGLGPDGQPCLWGDWRYDVAKLAHSVIGQYDRIILGRVRLHEDGPAEWRLEMSEQPHQAALEEIFLSQMAERRGIGRDELTGLTALLFFSMLPLHAERPDLQRMMLANALRLSAQIGAAP